MVVPNSQLWTFGPFIYSPVPLIEHTLSISMSFIIPPLVHFSFILKFGTAFTSIWWEENSKKNRQQRRIYYNSCSEFKLALFLVDVLCWLENHLAITIARASKHCKSLWWMNMLRRLNWYWRVDKWRDWEFLFFLWIGLQNEKKSRTNKGSLLYNSWLLLDKNNFSN